MAKKYSPSQAIRDSLNSRDPSILVKLVRERSTWDQMLELRREIGNEVIEPVYYALFFEWMWDDDPAIACAVRTIVLLLRDLELQIEIFTRLAQVDERDVPFIITYNSAEAEFIIELPGVPSWGVSHYGRDNPQIDNLLEALEKLYRKIHSGYIPLYFRS